MLAGMQGSRGWREQASAGNQAQDWCRFPSSFAGGVPPPCLRPPHPVCLHPASHTCRSNSNPKHVKVLNSFSRPFCGSTRGRHATRKRRDRGMSALSRPIAGFDSIFCGGAMAAPPDAWAYLGDEGAGPLKAEDTGAPATGRPGRPSGPRRLHAASATRHRPRQAPRNAIGARR